MNLILKFMTSQAGQQIITIYIYIYLKKCRQPGNGIWSVEYKSGNSFLPSFSAWFLKKHISHIIFY